MSKNSVRYAHVAASVLCWLSLAMANSKHNQIDNAPLSECQVLNQVQSTVIRILNSHENQGRQINLLRQLVEGLQKDIGVFKTSLEHLEERQSRLENPDQYALTPNEFDAKGIVHKMETNLSNLTEHLSQQNNHYQQLEKKYKRLRRMMSKVTTSVGKVENSVVNYMDESYTLEHFLKSQKDINSNIIHRIQFLERNVEEMKPQQDPPIAITQVDDCPQGFVRHFMSCYKFENITYNWIDAEKHCQGLHEGAHLISIESAEETEFIIRYRKYNEARWSSAYLWTGGNDMSTEGVWSWVGTKRPLTYTDWKAGAPNNHNKDQHCIYLPAEGNSNQWDDWHCYAARLNFVCEINLTA